MPLWLPERWLLVLRLGEATIYDGGQMRYTVLLLQPVDQLCVDSVETAVAEGAGSGHR